MSAKERENKIQGQKYSHFKKREARRDGNLVSVTMQPHILGMDRLLRSGPDAICLTAL
jgi:hypothetical protein